MIRDAVEADFPEIERHCARFWKETQFNDVPYVDGASIPYIKIALEHDLLFVLERGGEIVGFSAGCVAPLMGDSSRLSGTELAWWVDPEHRKGGGGIGLLKALESRARELGCEYWNMIAMQSSMPTQIESIYLKMGYNKGESTYTKRLV